MKLEEWLKNSENVVKCKVIIMEERKETYNDYLNKSRVYEYLRQMSVISIDISDNGIIIEVGNETEKIDECKEILEGEILSELMNYEVAYLKSPKELNIKAAEYWGMLLLASKLKVIPWDRAIYLFGEFMSKAMNVR